MFVQCTQMLLPGVRERYHGQSFALSYMPQPNPALDYEVSLRALQDSDGDFLNALVLEHFIQISDQKCCWICVLSVSMRCSAALAIV